MHKNGFFHRDLKPENILIQNENVSIFIKIKLCDFGLARELRSRPPFTEYVSTRWYRSPEIIIKGTNYNSPADIFALGYNKIKVALWLNYTCCRLCLQGAHQWTKLIKL